MTDIEQVYGEQDLSAGQRITFDFDGAVAYHYEGSGNVQVKGSATWREIYPISTTGDPAPICTANRLRSWTPSVSSVRMCSYAGWKWI